MAFVRVKAVKSPIPRSHKRFVRVSEGFFLGAMKF